MPPTSGFTLASLPRSPNVPGNIGKIGEIDAREIYDAVRAGLQTVESAGQAPNRALLAQNQTATSLAEGAARREVLPTLTQATLADTPNKSRLLALQLGEAEATAPLNRRKIEAQTRQAEAESTPEFIDAKLKRMLLSMNPTGVREFELLTAGLTPEEKERARRIKYGIDPRTSGAAIQYKEIVGEDGRTRLVAVDPRGVGAQVIPTGETYGTGVGSVQTGQTAPGSTPSAPGEAPPVTQASTDSVTAPAGTQEVKSAPSAFISPTIEQQKMQETTAKAAAEAKVDARVKLPKAKATLDTLIADTDRIENEIDQAINLASGSTTGVGALALKSLPMTDARKLEGLIKTIRATVGFDKLQQMRNNSPTGGALGNVSDFESQLLQSTIATLDQLQSTADVREALTKIKNARRAALALDRARFDHDVNFFGLTDADFSEEARKAAKPITGSPLKVGDKIGEFEIVEIK